MAKDLTTAKPSADAALAKVLPDPVTSTRDALAIMEGQDPSRAAHYRMLLVELQALVDGQIKFTDQGGKEVAMSPAQACAAIVHCARNGMSVAAGHVIPIGEKLYTTPAGYLAGAEWRGDFEGFAPVRAMTQAEKEFLGLSPDPNEGQFTGEGAGRKPKPLRYSCMVAVEGRRRGFKQPSVGYGWWDSAKDRENQKSVPAQTAISRARRRCLMGLYALGVPAPVDLEEPDVEAEVDDVRPVTMTPRSVPVAAGLSPELVRGGVPEPADTTLEVDHDAVARRVMEDPEERAAQDAALGDDVSRETSLVEEAFREGGLLEDDGSVKKD